MTFTCSSSRRLQHLLLVVALFVLSVPAVADSATAQLPSSPQQQWTLIPDNVTLDGQNYTRRDLIDAFTDIAFSTYIAPNLFPYRAAPPSPHFADLCAEQFKSTSSEPSSPVQRFSTTADGRLRSDTEICSTPAEVKQRYPWLSEYLYRGHGWPRFFVINKWTTPIRISIGYPQVLTPNLNADDKKTFAEKNWVDGLRIKDSEVESARPQTFRAPPDRKQAAEHTTAIAVEEIQAVAPLLHQLTGLPVSYVAHQQETADTVANLRVVIANDPRLWATPFRRFPVNPAGQVPQLRIVTGTSDPLYRTSLQFRNEIEQHLLTKVPFTPYSERQVDGFFLPKADNSIGMAFCFISNKIEPDVLKALVRECLVRSMGLPNAPRSAPSMVLGLWNDQTSNLARWRQWKSTTPPITEFDRFMIKTLYNPAVRPGMSVDDFYNLAINTDAKGK